MNIKEDTAKDPEGNQEHVIGNWRNGILVINWQKKKKKISRMMSYSYVESRTYKQPN